MLNLTDFSDPIRTFAIMVVAAQLIGAVATFKLRRDRRVGGGSLFMLGYVGVMIGSQTSELFVPALIPGVLGLAAGMGVFIWARVTIHGRYFSYINSRDVPEFVCSDGPYRWVRHPFYSSYLLALVGTTVMFPNPITAAGCVVAYLSFNSAAAFEENKFTHSVVAGEYVAYVRRTGRFVPRFPRVTVSTPDPLPDSRDGPRPGAG
jgi:protein-S-isoprenylcysteine O-methyltransferase Ste14